MEEEEGNAVRSLFSQAVELPTESRAAFLDHQCASEKIRKELIALLEADPDSESFLKRTVATAEPIAPGVGERFGPYETRKILGQGGMGVVFLADRVDGELSHTVAIKAIRQTWFDPRALERFRNERQFLAVLAHGNIARLIGGGTREDGIPYLAMEYVDGIPLDRHCNQLNLSAFDRLRLFLPICDAVEYAHGRLIIHRDLKPSNVLVTAQGEPKLLDFGIARALEAAPGEETRTLSFSPNFSSPEQARGEAATTAMDVYGLGGILYFLLTGQPTHSVEGLAPAQLQRSICETPPKAPSQLRPELKGDLENILLKALQMDPARRYRSAREFREDLARYLERRPVLATRDGCAYRARRFFDRHRTGTIAAVLALLAVAAGVTESLYQARRAERRFAQVRTLASKFVFDFEAAIRDTPGTLAARRMVASTARQYLADLSADAGRDASLNRDLAESYLRLSIVEWNAGESKAAVTDLKKSILLLKEIGDDCCGSADQRAKYIDEWTSLEHYQFNSQSLQEANQSSAEALKAARAWYALSNHDWHAAQSLARALFHGGSDVRDQGKLAEGRAMLEEAARLAATMPPGKNDAAAQFLHARALHGIGLILDAQGDPEGALKAAQAAAVMFEELRAKDPASVQYLLEEIKVLCTTGDFLERLATKNESFWPQASQWYRRGYLLSRGAKERNPGDAVILENYAFGSMKLANHLAHRHRPAEAIPFLRESVDATTEMVRRDPTRRNLYIQASNQNLMGTFLLNLDRYAEAETALVATQRLLSAALQASPGDLQLLRTKVQCLITQTSVARHLGKLPEARAHCQQALDLTATLIDRQKTSKRPVGSALADLRREAHLLGLHDFTLSVPDIR